MKAELFIGVVTYVREDYLKVLLGRLLRHTRASYELVVAEDSQAGAVDWCLKHGVRVVYGPNGGCARNKNRLLRYYDRFSTARHVVLIEDDARVWEPGWERAWINGSRRWGHINWAALDDVPCGEKATWRSPCFIGMPMGVCTVTSREAFNKVGYIDPRFGRYGYEHVEWSKRFAKIQNWGHGLKIPCFRHHVGSLFVRSHYDRASLDANRHLMDRLLSSDEPVYRLPWKTEEERATLELEVERAAAQSCASIESLIETMSLLPIDDQ